MRPPAFNDKFMDAYLFNPENDLALASGSEHYTPPKNAALLAECCALLPVWYAPARSIILSDKSDNVWFDKVNADYGLNVEISDKLPEDALCHPWGWSEYAASKFISAGVSPLSLPSKNQLVRLRELSHRKTSVCVVNALRQILPFDVPKIATEIFTVGELENYMSEVDNFYFKSPWSSTGRGVSHSSGMSHEEIIRRCKGIIMRQGSVMLEPAVEKVEDFAMLFYAYKGSVRHIGYSYFKNDGNSYSNNLLFTDDKICDILGRYVDKKQLERLSIILPIALEKVIGDAYNGYFGVDMMIYRDGAEYRIDVCTEINLRMTMGVVSRLWHKNFLAPGVEAEFSVNYGIKGDIYPEPVVVNRRLVRGVQNLVPAGREFSVMVKTL